MHHRLRQGLSALVVREAGPLPTPLVATARTARLFTALAPHDQRHLTAVHAACFTAGLSTDMATAGLLHAIGRCSLSGRRVTLVDRTLRVLMERLSPRLPRWVARRPGTGPTLGLAMAIDHADRGASRLSALGWPASIVLAVREHESDDAEGDRAALRRIDDATP